MSEPAAPKKTTIYTSPLTADQARKLEVCLREQGFDFEPRPYMLCFGKKQKLTVAIYEKGPKVVVQGRDTEEFVRFTLEPEILGEARLDYEEELNPDRFTPHFGIDESGKGDFFGPLVVAGAFTDAGLARSLRDAGVADSKRITSDAKIRSLADVIRKLGVPHNVLLLRPVKYNELMGKFGNLNRLLAWGHATIIENLCEARPDCGRALSDKFADVRVLERALKAKGRGLQLDQQTKAESDYAVAAASILAREKFIDWMDKAAGDFGLKDPFPRGASAKVKEVAIALVRARGEDCLAEVAKTHFKTAGEVLAAARAA